MSLRTHWREGDRFLVRHKDSSLLVVDKKAGLLTVRTESGKGDDLLSLLRELLGARGRTAGVRAVHRLDRAVSGLLVFARTQQAYQGLVEQFADHSAERRYLACVHGVMEGDRGTYESWLLTDDPSLKVRSDPLGPEGAGRRAVTHWRVLERLERAQATLLEVRLETGLRNQIRVHFAEDGHPLLGERKYADTGSEGPERIFLHAAVLGFEHPLSGEALRFESPLPPDLLGWKRRLSAERSPGPRARRRAHRPQRSRKKR